MNKSTQTPDKYIPFFKQRYIEERPRLATTLGVTNPHQIPQLRSVVLHTRYGQYQGDNVKKRAVRSILSTIAGRKAHEIVARTSVSQFKIRTGMICGCMATLRRDQMYHFLARLYIALPRMHNFTGFNSRSFDGRGNFNFGIEDQGIFLENERVDCRFGLDVLISTTARDNKSALALLRSLDFPFRN
jgi:large subunit ribosomal protein L5